MFLIFHVSQSPVIRRVLFHIIMKEESATVTLTITTALSNFIFLNHPHILHVTIYLLLFPPADACRALMALDARSQ